MRVPSLSLWVAGVSVGVAAFAVPAAHAAAYDVIVTPDKFAVQTFGINIQQDTAGAYPGDGPDGYYYINNYANAPSGTIIIPLPAGLPSGAHQYNIYEWNPTLHSKQYHVVDIAADGTMNNNSDHSATTGIPWTGAFGTNHQWLKNDQGNVDNLGGWLKLGPGPQSDPSIDGGSAVWINPDATVSGHAYPFLQIHFLGFENQAESFDAFRIVQIDATPEPTSGLLVLGGGAMWTAMRRRRRLA